MMNAQPFVGVEAEPPPAFAPSTSVVVFTTVYGTLLDSRGGLCPEVRAALDALANHGVPVVLWSADRAIDLMNRQAEFGFRHPFISRGGAELYVPTLYFPEPIGLGREDGPWTVIDCSRASRPNGGAADGAQAIRLLVCLYRVYRDDVLIVGVGSEWRDRDLLHEVDVPVVVTRDDCEQTRLVRRFPEVYVTRAIGTAGWCEAILGAGEDA